MKRAIGPGVKEAALSALRGGADPESVSQIAGVTLATVKRWAEATPKPDAPEPMPEGLSALEQVQWMVRDMQRSLTTAREAGNDAVVVRIMGNLSRLAPVLTRAEAAQRDEGGAIHVSVEEMARLDAALRERWSKLLHRAEIGGGLRCADCGRRLSLELAGVTGDMDVRDDVNA